MQLALASSTTELVVYSYFYGSDSSKYASHFKNKSLYTLYTTPSSYIVIETSLLCLVAPLGMFFAAQLLGLRTERGLSFSLCQSETGSWSPLLLCTTVACSGQLHPKHGFSLDVETLEEFQQKLLACVHSTIWNIKLGLEHMSFFCCS